MTGQMTGREALTCLVRATASAGTQVEAGRTLHNLLAERDELAAIVQDLASQREWQPVKMRGYKSMRMYLACPLCDGDSAEIEHGDSIQDPPSMVHDSHCPIGRARVWCEKQGTGQ